jgi:hypothetical protein
MTEVCCCANSSIFIDFNNKVNQICNVIGTFVILYLTHGMYYCVYEFWLD